MRTVKTTSPPVKQLPALQSRDGCEWLYVLVGRLRLRLGKQDLLLARGEATEFGTRVPHALTADGGRPAQVLGIFNDEGARIRTHGPLP